MSHALLTRKLPAPNKGALARPLEHHCRREPVEHTRHARLLEHRPERVCVPHALVHVGAHALNALLRERVPHEERCVAVAATHDGRVARIEVLNVTAQGGHVPQARHDHSAGQRRADKLVARDAHAADGLLEAHQRHAIAARRIGARAKGSHHAEEGAVAVDIEPILVVALLAQHGNDAVQVVHRALDRGADVDVDDCGPRNVLPQPRSQLLQVDLACCNGANLLVVHAVHARRLGDAVVRLLGAIQNPVRQHLAADQDAVQVALRSAIGHVGPVLLARDAPQVGEPVQHTHLKLARVHAIVRLDPRVAQVVDREALQARKLAEVEVQVVGVAQMQRGALLQRASVVRQDGAHARGGGLGADGRGLHHLVALGDAGLLDGGSCQLARVRRRAAAHGHCLVAAAAAARLRREGLHGQPHGAAVVAPGAHRARWGAHRQ
mmetsp:Transcript_18301/g.56736  ORF Transcript_18301/g.56736 Transcript_18301/m.56736 type:complete len:437 (-) Transcript_18301:47-1357(-)